MFKACLINMVMQKTFVLNLKTGERRGLTFVVFQQHEVCDQVFNTAKLLSVNDHLVQKSRPSKAVSSRTGKTSRSV